MDILSDTSYKNNPWSSGINKVNSYGIMYDSNNPYERDLFEDSPSAIFKNYGKTLDFSNKNDLSNLSMLAPSQNERGFLSGISDWFSNADNLDLALGLGGNLINGLISWNQGNKTYNLGREALQNNINANRAQFAANAANALDKKNFHTMAFNAAMKDAAPDAVAQNNRNAMAYAQALGNAAQQIGINPNNITNQLQQYNQLKA